MDFVEGAGGDHPGDRIPVQGFDGGLVIIREDNAAHGVWADNTQVLLLKGVNHVVRREGAATREWEK